ncbi:MAG TPA: hypothetical protein VEB61_00005, partial [Candidatus Binatia bacterium]|nr:hypothetical protein [Candidatus Binatia bacterium]
MASRTARSRENALRLTQMVLRQSQGKAEAAAKQLTPRSRLALAFIVFVVIFAGITISSFRLQSPTFDEP